MKKFMMIRSLAVLSLVLSAPTVAQDYDLANSINVPDMHEMDDSGAGQIVKKQE